MGKEEGKRGRVCMPAVPTTIAEALPQATMVIHKSPHLIPVQGLR